MSERMDNIENQMQTEVEMALGVKHRKDVGVPMFGALCFICKDGGSANILVNYLQNNMGFELTCQDCNWYLLRNITYSSICHFLNAYYMPGTWHTSANFDLARNL